jgi:hypothetical protein
MQYKLSIPKLTSQDAAFLAGYAVGIAFVIATANGLQRYQDRKFREVHDHIDNHAPRAGYHPGYSGQRSSAVEPCGC